ncbi:hypothetical protein Poly30_28730 [Planctomycetes bacterium Poly30]|uniref:Histidine kinase n=1 Tax=Saltatorellus ferox TaxID=2528018 RepID=A0A518ETD2_9BACT|nr:hypothetical protein Poly30_28730 [Planctomycetes bacterium Poly30]
MTPSDPTARVLLPVLLHEVNNATQLLVGLRAILELPGGEAMFNSRADDLGRTSAMMDDLGFALAVVATAGGANMLLSRRDDRSVRILWDLAGKALTRHGGAIRSVGDPPLTAPSALDGWQLAWSVAALLIAASGEDGGLALAWRWEWTRTDEGGARLVGQLDSEHWSAEDVIGREMLEWIAERVTPNGAVVADGHTLIWSVDAASVRQNA